MLNLNKLNIKLILLNRNFILLKKIYKIQTNNLINYSTMSNNNKNLFLKDIIRNLIIKNIIIIGVFLIYFIYIILDIKINKYINIFVINYLNLVKKKVKLNKEKINKNQLKVMNSKLLKIKNKNFLTLSFIYNKKNKKFQYIFFKYSKNVLISTFNYLFIRNFIYTYIFNLVLGILYKNILYLNNFYYLITQFLDIHILNIIC